MKKPSPYVLLILATVFWGGNFVLGRAVADDIPPSTISLLRWCIGLVVFFPFVYKRLPSEWPSIRQHWPVVLVMSLTGIAGFNSFVYVALHHTTSINASLVNSSTPILIFILSFLFLKDRLHRFQAVGAVLSIAGVLFILTKGSLENILSLSFNGGDLLMVAAVVCWSIYSMLVKQFAGRLPGYTTFFVCICIGIIILLPFSIVELFVYERAVHWHVSSIGAMLYFGIFASIAAFTCWNTAVEEVGAGKAGIFLNFIPVFATIFAVLLLGEQVAWYQGVGGLLVVAGVYLSTKVPKTYIEKSKKKSAV